MHDTTRLLSAIEQGDGQSTERLLPLVYDELHRLAAELVARERPVKPSRPRPWSTRPISASWIQPTHTTGTVEPISSPPGRRRCGGSWSRTRGGDAPKSTEEVGIECRSTICMSRGMNLRAT